MNRPSPHPPSSPDLTSTSNVSNRLAFASQEEIVALVMLNSDRDSDATLVVDDYAGNERRCIKLLNRKSERRGSSSGSTLNQLG